jgi:hypothetical protein
MTVSFAAVVLVGCGRSNSNTTKEEATAKPTQAATGGSQGTASPTVQQTSAPSRAPAMLATNGAAYVRIKEYSATVSKDATPPGSEAAFQFGDAVTLVQERDVPVVSWLCAKDQIQAWIPAYMLTANRSEIAFLKDNNLVPETMTYLSNDGKAWGTVNMGFATLLGVEGMPAPSPSEPGTSPYAVRGNAVLIDSAAAKQKWTYSPVFDSAKKGFPLSPTCLYYCVSGGNNAAFQCVDLITLKIQK